MESGFQERDVHCSAGTPVYYKFIACILEDGGLTGASIQIIGTPYATTGGFRSVVLKRGSLPTVEEIEYMNLWLAEHGFWTPHPAGYEDFYIFSSGGLASGILLEAKKPTPKSLWYAAFYSPKDTTLAHISISSLSNCP